MIEEVLTGFGSKEIQEAEESLDAHALRVFENNYRDFRPLFGRLLIRVLPREQFYGHIVLPDVKQNKPVWEGIVLRVWEPREIEVTKKVGGEKVTKSIVAKSDYSVGDHIAFPFWAGIPVPGMNEDRYRIVPEGVDSFGQRAYGNDHAAILGIVDYQKEDSKAIIERIITNHIIAQTDNLANDLLEELEILPKQRGSKTISGA